MADRRTDGGTESIAITAGETKNPTKNMPRVVKNVFWRILLFYMALPDAVELIRAIDTTRGMEPLAEEAFA